MEKKSGAGLGSRSWSEPCVFGSLEPEPEPLAKNQEPEPDPLGKKIRSRSWSRGGGRWERGVFRSLGPEPEPLEKKNEEPEPEPEPLGKKSQEPEPEPVRISRLLSPARR